MNDIEPVLIPRREFLRGATLLAAAAMLGLETAGEAAASPVAAASLTTLAFWSGIKFIDPSSFPAGDASLTAGGVRVKIHGHCVPSGSDGMLLHVLKVHYAVPVNGRLTDQPYYAWVATTQRGKDSTLRAPVGLAAGLLFSVDLNSAKSAEEYYFLGAGKTASQAKLLPGDYVVAAGAPDWRGCRIVERNGVSSIVRDAGSGSTPVNFEYLLITVSAA